MIGNIPYYISTPIIEKLIVSHKNVSTVFLTVQLEFGNRLASRAGSKDYGSLTCFVQFYAEVKALFKIKSACFKPVPKVDSCFIRLDFTKPFDYLPKDQEAMFKLIRTVFSQRRKNILNAASVLIEKERLQAILIDLKISPQARPEELNLHNFVDISNRLV